MSRIASVDLFRVFAVMAVIVIHTGPFLSPADSITSVFQLGVILNQFARFAVPFFFAMSGYFWGLKIQAFQTPWSVSAAMLSKLALIFLFWSAVYMIPFDIGAMYQNGVGYGLKQIFWHMHSLSMKPELFILEGTKVHLWFLPALACTIVISTLMVQRKWFAGLIVLATALYIFGLLTKGYVDTPISIHVPFNTRNGPFFGTIFFVSGYFLSHAMPKSNWLVPGLLIAAFGFLLQSVESYFLNKLYNTPLLFDYLIGTYFAGIGIAIAVLSGHRFLQVNFLRYIGQITLGIYACHYIFVDMLSGVSRTKFGSSVPWQLSYVAVVFLLALGLTMALSKLRVTRRFVM